MGEMQAEEVELVGRIGHGTAVVLRQPVSQAEVPGRQPVSQAEVPGRRSVCQAEVPGRQPVRQAEVPGQLFVYGGTENRR